MLQIGVERLALVAAVGGLLAVAVAGGVVAAQGFQKTGGAK